jgi:hypothetical protein
LAFIIIIALTLTTSACAGTTIHGLNEAEWMQLLAGDAPLPFQTGDHIDFEAIEKLGPGALLFLGMAAHDRKDDALAAIFFRKAAQRETGRYRERAAALLADYLVETSDGEDLLELCSSEAGNALAAYRKGYLQILGYSLQSLHRQATSAIDILRAEFPEESGRDAVQLASISLESGFLAGQGRWSDEFALLVGTDGSTAVYEALARAVALIAESGPESVESAVHVVGTGAFQLAEARSLVGSRDFGPAVIAFRRYALDQESATQIAMRLAASADTESDSRQTMAETIPLQPEILTKLLRNLPRPAASEAARSLLAASYREGAHCFSYMVETMHDWSVYPSRKYFETYWHGRFLREAGKWKEAEIAFSMAVEAAASQAEKDTAAWYVVDCATQRSTPDAIAALGKALASSRNPGYFSDLIEPLSRTALVDRKGATLVALDAAIAGKASAFDSARMSYLCARSAQTGIITAAEIKKSFGETYSDLEGYTVERLERAWNQMADPWYRMAAAYRLGKPLAEMREPEPESSTDTTAVRTGNIDDSDTISADEYALQLARFGQGDRIRTELGPEFNTLKPETVRTAATTLRDSGRPSQAYRLIATQFWKAAFKPTRTDAELYWPRPFHEYFITAAASVDLDEFLLYGLARSESAFDPSVVSKSGAVGLAQLMPATAAEMAGRLKLTDWSLTDPEDNLTLGSAYFARLLAGTGDRVMPAIFSYNAGPSRYRRWESEYGDLPADLMLEALSYAETRQYARNVTGASLAYAALYGEVDLRAYCAWLLGEGPQP